MNRILVITATLGNRPSISRTIDGVKNINKGNIKHVIVAPEDKIPEIKAKYNIDCIAEKGKGIYGALNHAFFTLAKDYDYITFINDDDYWLPSFNQMIQILEKDSSIDFIYSKTLFIDENNHIFKKQSCSDQFYSFLNLFHRNIILFTQQTTLLKPYWFFKIGGFDESYKLVADTKFWIQLSLLKPKYKYLNSFTTCYTIQENQLSNDKSIQRTEHDRLKKEYPINNSLKASIIAFKYRISNLKNYVKRLLNSMYNENHN